MYFSYCIYFLVLKRFTLLKLLIQQSCDTMGICLNMLRRASSEFWRCIRCLTLRDAHSVFDTYPRSLGARHGHRMMLEVSVLLSMSQEEVLKELRLAPKFGKFSSLLFLLCSKCYSVETYIQFKYANRRSTKNICYLAKCTFIISLPSISCCLLLSQS